jgi:hypothetical protein
MMESLSLEAKALYELLKAETTEAFEARFLDYKKEMTVAVRQYVTDTGKQIETMNKAVDGVRISVAADLEATRASIGTDLDTIKTSLGSEIAALAAAVERIPRPNLGAEADRPSTSLTKELGGGAAGPDGHHFDNCNRGPTDASHWLSPVGGMNPGRNFSNPFTSGQRLATETDTHVHASPVDLPQFDGANRKLWQRPCEEYFQRWQTPSTLWASYASGQFSGAAATWLEAFLNQTTNPSWTEFTAAVHAQFSRNQHQILVRRLFHISQTSTVEDYVTRYSELMDQIAAYESRPDPLHYTTRFLDGLQPAVRILVAIQQPRDLDTAYNLALLYEELGDGSNPLNTTPPYTVPARRALPALPPPPPAKWVSRTVEEKRTAESQKQSTDEKWQTLKAYRRSKGLCFVCGEKYSRDHRCKTSIQLHVVQEMIDYLQVSEDSDCEQHEPELELKSGETQLMMISLAALDTSMSAPKSMQLQVMIQGQLLLFLVDSGSSSCFIDTKRAQHMSGKYPLALSVQVKVAGGALLQCTHCFPALDWSAGDTVFIDAFRILDLGGYDGIIGLD